MSKLLILMMDHEYPFTKKSMASDPLIKTQVEQILPISQHNRNAILAKANFIKNLKNKYLIKVESMLQDEDTVHLMYQLVENKLKDVLESVTTLLFNKILAQLHEFGRYLSNIGVRILFDIDRMGFTENEMLKYFMGIDFDWQQDPDEEYLQQFYSKQVEELLSPYIKNHNVHEVQLSSSQSLGDKNKYRKVSFTTLPSRFSRMHKIDEKLREMKSTPKEGGSPYFKRKESNAFTVHKIGYYPNSKGQYDIAKRIEKRKFSGDVKLESMTRFRLAEKESDIKSEYLRKRTRNQGSINQQQPLHSQVGTHKTKSRTEEMKQKEYKEMLSKNKGYMKDFMSVLQQVQECNQNPENVEQIQEYPQENSRKSQFTIRKQLSTSILMEASTQELQAIAHRSIQHSIYVMQQFKILIYDI